MCFCKREWCRIGKHYYPGTRCKMTARHRKRERQMRELLRGDIICVSGSEHLSIYIQSSSAPQWELMYNSCGTCERAINTVAPLVSMAPSQHLWSPKPRLVSRASQGELGMKTRIWWYNVFAAEPVAQSHASIVTNPWIGGGGGVVLHDFWERPTDIFCLELYPRVIGAFFCPSALTTCTIYIPHSVVKTVARLSFPPPCLYNLEGKGWLSYGFCLGQKKNKNAIRPCCVKDVKEDCLLHMCGEFKRGRGTCRARNSLRMLGAGAVASNCHYIPLDRRINQLNGTHATELW